MVSPTDKIIVVVTNPTMENAIEVLARLKAVVREHLSVRIAHQLRQTQAGKK